MALRLLVRGDEWRASEGAGGWMVGDALVRCAACPAGWAPRRQTVAENWLKLNFSVYYEMRMKVAAWRELPVTKGQVELMERHKVPYDPGWTRGSAADAMDKYALQVSGPASPVGGGRA